MSAMVRSEARVASSGMAATLRSGLQARRRSTMDSMPAASRGQTQSSLVGK